jgi:predicted  nucleic acid-binding Zn-ribbon protein
MTMEETVRALADLSEVDRRLSGEEELTKRVARTLEGRRAALRGSIPGNLLAAYDDLGRAGRRPAVVALVRGAHCGGCYMRIPPQLEGFVRRGQALCSCPHCRRLIFSSAREADDAGGNGPESNPAMSGRATKRGTGTGERRTPRATGTPKKSRPS